MQQQIFIKSSHRKEHGGALSHRKRRSKRILSIKNSIHVTLRSDFAYGARSLLKHQILINHILKKFSKKFGIRVYRYAICGNHIHLLIKGKSRVGLQNFFRVFAGHTAQGILQSFPIRQIEYSARDIKRGGAPILQGCLKNRRQFWDLLLYTRSVTWGREFKTVARYILQNTLEALNIIAYVPRKNRRLNNTS
jgi:REP element-mobilizing transposase RayT